MSEEKSTSKPITAETKPAKAEHFLWRNFGILLGTFAVIVLLAAFYMAYFRLATSVTNLASAINHLEIRFNGVKENVDDVQILSQQFIGELKKQAQVIDALHQAQMGNRDDWRVAEAEYWVKLANDHLQFENNLPLALALIQTADKELSEITDGKTAPIRKALAEDMANLQNAPRFDLVGVYSRLSALNTMVDKLPLQINQTKLSDEQTSSQEKLPWWKRGLRETGRALSQIVVVRYNKPGTVSLVTPDQQMLLYQNCHATLERAMWALLHKQPDIYRASLQQASGWVKLYFVQDSPLTQSFLNTLNEMEKMDINPPLPKLTSSLQAFDEYFKQTRGA